ncbi:MAG: class I SAM-dependent methyltransferase ['Candidatus Kapabacteria' thiocyanatum]|uniref:SAM-dependent methyltransferase n=1 Tax=Candidatus Kapaibacterium thiocyanatum TaxID=1895771 RepID=A0A1M3L5D6_9BACT|nr:class I SAM-dependent methyltransferase ['Candidatus Kapabacteria' thiocyanatum]OJX60763.1 MAG: SAM-dependent methyltransferase ['Candidatus Kapabacteria' thiocyanatum]
MNNEEIPRPTHWNTVFATKGERERSWYQKYPAASMNAIASVRLPYDAAIIDVGGGDSYLVDTLLDKGFTNVTVLDISAQAIENAKTRLGERADLVRWIVSDITEYEPDMRFDFWHDRAALHFLTNANDVEKYVAIAHKSIRTGGHLFLGTFSVDGPKRCSALDVTQYSEETMTTTVGNGFERLWCKREDHTTPFATTQNFLFCLFRKTG